MNSLKNLIQHCHKRHEKPLRQKKTLLLPATYKGVFYHFTVLCASRYPVKLYDLEHAEISFMPIGHATEHDRLPQSFGGKRFLTRQTRADWDLRHWNTSWGIHIYTGTPSQRGDARWHDLDFSYHAICAAPDAVLSCIQVLCNAVVNPLLVITKSGGCVFLVEFQIIYTRIQKQQGYISTRAHIHRQTNSNAIFTLKCLVKQDIVRGMPGMRLSLGIY